jgi:hypothetical protein
MTHSDLSDKSYVIPIPLLTLFTTQEVDPLVVVSVYLRFIIEDFDYASAFMQLHGISNETVAANAFKVISKIKEARHRLLDEQFEKFWMTYPAFANNRPLRHDKIGCRKLYNNYVMQSLVTPEQLQRALEKEIELRSRTEADRFWVEIKRWLQEQRWESYAQQDSETKALFYE